MAKSDVSAVPTPAYILRGHVAQVHAVHFTPGNWRLLSGDADGWVVSWDLVTKRAAAAWQAHENAILGLGSWQNRIVSQGRDNRLRVWQYDSSDETRLSSALPADHVGPAPPCPWLLFEMPINALNFCAFAMCYDEPSSTILFAVPNAIDDGGIDIFHLPSKQRRHVIASDANCKTGMAQSFRIFRLIAGMVMAVAVRFVQDHLCVAAGFENGEVIMRVRRSQDFVIVYRVQGHTQPGNEHFVTASADANIVKHPLASNVRNTAVETAPLLQIKSHHCGQQGISHRSDGLIFATAGWDNAARIYSTKSLKEGAVLLWHQAGCYATAFANILPMENALVSKISVQEARQHAARNTHWLAVGSKDGKISLWNLY